MKITRYPSDDAFSKCIRERADFICEYCGMHFRHSPGELHCSHYITRGQLSTRYHPSNAFAHCERHHSELGGGRWGGGNVAEFTAHYDSVFGDVEREVLRALSQRKFRKHKIIRHQIAEHYRNELKIMQAKRADGVTGRIDFDQFTEFDLFEEEVEIRQQLSDEFARLPESAYLI